MALWFNKVFCVLAVVYMRPTSSLWSCTDDAECGTLRGSVCVEGACACPAGQQPVLGGTLCADVAPYHTSTCVEDHQCSRMTTAFECRAGEEDEGGICFCQPGFHYFLGRCWRTVDFGDQCVRSEECLSVQRDPYSMQCNNTCACADGYYERQRGECRKVGFAVGDGCVLDTDCQFEGGACGASFRCYNTNVGDTASTVSLRNVTSTKMAAVRSARQHGAACSVTAPCPEPFECTSFGACVCPIGYYASDNGNMCYAELGSPASEDICVGLFAEVSDGICTCPANFFFEENMRDCTKATRRITDSCVTDANCHTFGAATRCGEPQQWELRSCECVPELAVWDSARQMCRLFAGIGEYCQVDTDCLAGELEIQCIIGDDGQGTCTCPEGYLAVGNLCLTTGLALGDACQATLECTETPNTVCEDGVCACDSAGYQELDGVCAPIIGGVCAVDGDCVIENTACVNGSSGSTCQCRGGFVEYSDSCWPAVSGIEAPCNVTAQCADALGESGACVEGVCRCGTGYHHRDGACWPVTGLFESCSRTSQCYLSSISDRVVCRNSLCQCDFNYPYSEEQQTCLSSATGLTASFFLILSAVLIKLS